MNAPPKGVDEAEFQKVIVETAQLLGWHVFHVADSRREVIDRRRGLSFMVGDKLAKGWPDLALAHPRWHVFAVRELKTDKGRVTPEQKAWLELLASCGIDADLWRPRNWDESIVPFLTNRRNRGTRRLEAIA